MHIQLQYSRIIGSIMYLMYGTRPDIASAVGMLGSKDWEGISWVFRYLKGTTGYGLHYHGYPYVLEGYSDASWNIDMESKSTSGWIFTLSGGSISWR